MYIETKDLTKRIRGTEVLSYVNLRFEGGKIYGLKGKNGSGKTMLMRAVCGLITPTEGIIDVNGEILGKDISFPRRVGVLIENPSFIPSYTGLKNLQILASIQKRIDENKIRETMINIGLNPDDRRPYKKYSLGMKQRLGIAAAVMEEPELLILDEPLNALDEGGVIQVREMLRLAKERGAISIIACHDTEELEELSDEIIKISDGMILE